MPITAGPNVQSLLGRFSEPTGLHVPASQVGILSDAARTPVAPTEPVIRNTVVNFLKESRAQDRIILLIVGHVVEIEGEPVLLPIDGMTDSKDGTIPLKWVYDQLAACKARQKVLILDTCRLDPAKGLERPGSGPMGAKLDAMLKEPPPGVQVWTACVAEQFSYEFEGGDKINNGLFLDSLSNVVERHFAGEDSEPHRLAAAGAVGGGGQRRDEGGAGAAGEGADLAADGVGGRGRRGARREGADAAEAAGGGPRGPAGRQRRPDAGSLDPSGHLLPAAEGGQGPQVADGRVAAALPGRHAQGVREGRRGDAAAGRGR